MYNFTFTTDGLLIPFQAVNSIVPLASTFILVIIPFFILLMAMMRFGIQVSFTTSSFLAMLLSILFVATGLVPPIVFTMFLALAIIGFIWTSMKDNSVTGL